MSEDRTQAPSKLRRQQARERGIVARSGELTAALALLAAIGLLRGWGYDLARGLVELVRAPLMDGTSLMADPSETAAHLRDAALHVLLPLSIILGGTAAVAILVHQIQVGGLWIPSLLAPDPRRLANGVNGTGASDRGLRGAWALLKVGCMGTVTAWAISTHLPEFDRLGRLEPATLATAVGGLLHSLAGVLTLTLIPLGLADFALSWWRLETYLRMTPGEQREELRALDGDPALRARRRHIARSWRSEAVPPPRSARRLPRMDERRRAG
jgi:flagellar biosynthetic protein FlhB